MFDLTYLTDCRGDADARIDSCTRLLHAARCWVTSVAWWMSMSRCLQSSFTMSIHLFLGLPCLLVPCTYPWSASFGNPVWSILCTWPKYCIRRCCMRFATSWSRPTYHTPLYSWSCLCELLLQFSSNRTFQIPVICFPVLFVQSPSFRVVHEQTEYMRRYILIYLQLRGVTYVCRRHNLCRRHTFFNIWNTVLANPILLLQWLLIGKW